ncbi:DMT family transporter [Arthrobacter sp. BPSS-3]|uniref:DMT family transporter n=1 Tax=Arthrobacter sp. BPSS-3 TaxID=3366580 RepID=UPI0037DCF7B5
MKANSSATVIVSAPLSTGQATGYGWGLLGVAAFSLTVPMTRLTVGGMSPLFIGAGRAVVAAVLGGVVLAATGQPFPSRRQWLRLAVVAGGIVLGFPLLTSFALRTAAASHGAVVIALLPAATAAAVVLRTRTRQGTRFWAATAAGALAAAAFGLLQSGGIEGPQWADVLLLGAVASAAVGYAEGGLLARELGSWQTVSWALVGAFPVMAGLTVLSVVAQPIDADPGQWAAFGYLAVVSMFLGFFAWYRGLALGPMAKVSQIQLVQPVLSIGWAALLLGEPVGWLTVAGGLAVILCAALAVRARVGSSG